MRQPQQQGALSIARALEGVASSDFEVSEYDIGTTAVRLIRVGNVIQLVFSRKAAAEIFYAEAAARLKRDEEEWKLR